MSLFFWKKNKQTATQQAKELMPALIEQLPEFAPAIRQIMNKNADNFSIMAVGQATNGDMIGKLYDFIVNLDGSVEANFVHGSWDVPPANILPQNNPNKKEDNRKPAKPKDVENELERIPTPWDVDEKNIDENINLLKDKITLSSQRYVSAQIQAMIERMENRRKYREYREFYELFPNTNEEKVDALLSRYKLCLKTTDLFIPSFPADAIAVMKKYKETTLKLCAKEPVFYVIAEEKDFEKKHRKLDPILLVQSPFGFYWQILGAWDKEMLLLSEL